MGRVTASGVTSEGRSYITILPYENGEDIVQVVLKYEQELDEKGRRARYEELKREFEPGT